MICGHVIQDDFFRTVCVMPRSHPQGFHMDAAEFCPWCSCLTRPEVTGDAAPVRNEHGVTFHASCLAALHGELEGMAA